MRLATRSACTAENRAAPVVRARSPVCDQQSPVWIRGLAAAALSLVLDSALVQPHALAAAPTPYAEGQKAVQFGVLNGRIQACPSNINPNCVSTSSNNQAYSPVWRSSASSPKAALLDIESVMLGTRLKATKLIEADTPDGWYSAYAVPGRFDKPDIVEFLVKGGITDRNWEADTPAPVVFYRSIAGEVKYIWPITQPLTDGDVQKKRMQSVREALGWKLVGCELVECYNEEAPTQQFKLF